MAGCLLGKERTTVTVQLAWSGKCNSDLFPRGRLVSILQFYPSPAARTPVQSAISCQRSPYDSLGKRAVPHRVHTQKPLSRNPSTGTNGKEDHTLVRNVDLEDSLSGFRSHLCDSLCPYERVTYPLQASVSSPLKSQLTVLMTMTGVNTCWLVILLYHCLLYLTF